MAESADDPAQELPKTRSLGAYQVPPQTMARLEALLEAIRGANHRPPSRGLFLSALIYGACRSGRNGEPDGEYLETEVMAPYLRDHPDEERPS